MHRSVEYIISFVILILAQIFIFDNFSITNYMNAYVYIMMIMILPMDMRTTWLMLIGFCMGWIVDLTSGGAGLGAMCLTFIAFIRQRVIILVSGREVLSNGGMPSMITMGGARFWLYITAMTLSFNIPYFMLESMTFTNFGHTLLRIILSTAFTAVIIFSGHLLLIRNKKGWQ